MSGFAAKKNSEMAEPVVHKQSKTVTMANFNTSILYLPRNQFDN